MFVFDPLAIILILAANNSIKWERETNEHPENHSPELVAQEQATNVPSSTQLPTIDITAEEKEMAANVITSEEKPAVNDQLDDQVDAATPDFTQGHYRSTYTLLQPKFVFEQQTAAIDDIVANQQTISQVDDTVSSVQPSVDIETNGVTTPVELYSNQDEYVTYDGKKIKVDALKQLRPDLVVNGPIQNNILFGSKFPTSAKTSDIHTRVDVLPHRTYKFNGNKWIQVNREENTTYLQNTAYIQYLISKIDSGEYDPGLLTYAEQEEISEYLKRTT